MSLVLRLLQLLLQLLNLDVKGMQLLSAAGQLSMTLCYLLLVLR